MPSLQATITFTPASGGAALTLPGPGEIGRDQFGNVTFTWRDPVTSLGSPERVTVDTLTGYLSSGIDQKRNRVGTFLAVTDAGGALQTVEWAEVDPWTGALLGPYSAVGVIGLSAMGSAGNGDSLTLILYLAYYRFERGTGILESVS